MKTPELNSRVFLTLICSAACLLSPHPLLAQSSPEAQEKQICTEHLEKIFSAIQSYRKDHKDTPMWLSDLTPKHLSDKGVLTCPAARRTRQPFPFPHLADPKVATSYLYEFCPVPMGSVWNGGEISMRDWKRRQMGLIGSDVPIVRCWFHSPTLNISFAGTIFESGGNWEENFTSLVRIEDFSPQRLFAGATLEPRARPPTRETPTPELEVVSAGHPAPDFELPLLEGGEVNLSEHRNENIVILDFWATWCGPCRQALPLLTQVVDEYKNKGVILYGVDLREDPQTVRNYLKESGVKLTVLLDRDGSVGRSYGVTGIPHTVIVGKEGRVEKVHVGYSPKLKERMRQDLDAILAAKENR